MLDPPHPEKRKMVDRPQIKKLKQIAQLNMQPNHILNFIQFCSVRKAMDKFFQKAMACCNLLNSLLSVGFSPLPKLF